MVDATIDILKLCGINKDLICPDKKIVNYNSSYHIKVLHVKKNNKVLHVTAMTRLLCQLNAKDFKHAFNGFTLMSLEEYC